MSYSKSKLKKFPFDRNALQDIKLDEKGTRWPVVYLIKNDKEIYIGETTNAYQRTKEHLRNEERKKLKDITIISNDMFNKSATLDIENNLIEYLNADNMYKIQNRNKGVSGHNYYQRSSYNQLLQDIWKQLIKEGIAQRQIQELANTDLFKYSPYKSLTPDQYDVTHQIIEDISKAIINKENRTIIVKGGAGTGKTVLAIYLMKLLSDNASNKVSTLDSDAEFDTSLNLDQLRNIKSVLVVPQTSLRTTLGNVFKDVDGLKKNMVIGASAIIPKKPIIIDNQIINKEVTVAIVDEAHRLRQNVNVSGFQSGTFKKNDEKLQLENSNELDWIVKSSQVQVLFYDEYQSVKPTDIDPYHFDKTLNNNKITIYNLDTQMRVRGGEKYIEYVTDILHENNPTRKTFDNYDLKIFDDVEDMVNEIKNKDKEFGLCRTVAGYSWDWVTKGLDLQKIQSKNLYDIDIKGYHYIWNSTNEDWVNSNNAINEIGSIHTIQGYDLNYVGVIFGKEITFNPETSTIEVHKDEYKDIYGKNTIKDIDELKQYIINIYKVFLTRGIKGTYIYIVDDNLKNYMKKFI